MFIGHFAVGFAAKRAAPRAPLTVLLMAALFLDVLWPIFLWLGIEQVRIAPGNTAFTPLEFVSYPWSHSLLMTLAWSLIFAWVYLQATNDGKGSTWVALVVVSHWVLDWVSHRPDMPLVPWGGPRVGLGLWNSIPATAIVEIAMFLTGLGLYLSATRAKGWQGHLSLWSIVAVLAFLYAQTLQATPPPSVEALKIVSTVMLAFFLWFVWVDRTRESRLATHGNSR